VKFLPVFLICLFGLFTTTKAQNLKVVGNNGTPVAQAVIILKILPDNQEQFFYTNNKGVASIPPYLVKTQVVVSHLSYEMYVDTLSEIKNDLKINLIAKDIRLDEVVVTSEYTPRIAGESIHPVMVISRTQIDNQAATTLDEVLAQQLNIRIAQDLILGSAMSMNGISGQNIKILVDGVPVIGRLDGNIDISQINLNNVERIEMVNGPMATSYGTDASAGVINVITRQAVDKQYQTGVNLMYQNTGHYNADFLTGYNTRKSSFMVSGGRNFFDGWSADETGRWQQWKPKEHFFGNVKYRWVGKKLIFAYQVNAFNETISNKGTPRISPYFAYAFDEYYKTIRITNQVNGSYLINKDYLVNGNVSYSNYHRNKNTYRKDLVTLNEILIPGSEQQDTTILNSIIVRGTFSRSTADAQVNYQAGIDFNIDNADGTRFNNNVKHAADYAVFASAEYKINSRLDVKPAIRLAHNTEYKAPVTPSVMFRYDVTKTIQARLSYGKGFRAPGIKERYLFFVDINHNIRGNEYLLPEYSDNFFLNVSKKTVTSKIVNSIEISGFYNDIRNMITLAQPDPNNSLYTYINLGKFSTHGASLTNTINYHKLTLGTGISYTGRYNIYSDSGDFKKYIYSPDLNIKAEYNFKKADLTVSVYYKYNGKLPGYKLNTDNTISQFSNDSYKFLDASVRKGLFSKMVYVSGGIKNILDVTNVSATTQGTAHSGDDNQQAVGTGRTYFIKLQFNLSR